MNHLLRATLHAVPMVGAFLTVFALVTTTKSAQAQSIGYTLTISGDVNVPTFTLSNDATIGSGINLTNVLLTIGNTAQNYDAAYLENAGATGISFTRLSPDGNDGGGLRADFIEYSLTGFDPGESFLFRADIDDDSVNSNENYRVVLFNNGAAPNAQLTVNFSNGGILTQTLADQTPGLSTYTFTQSSAVVTVPEPASVVLLGLGIVGMIARRKRGTA